MITEMSMTERDAVEHAYQMLAEVGIENGEELRGRDMAMKAYGVSSWLEAHAPGILKRQCPACGRLPTMPCHEPYNTERGRGWRNRIIPHDARVTGSAQTASRAPRRK